jgi:amino acid permease
MKLEIKKKTVIVIVEFACLITGLSLLQISFEAISHDGIAGYITLAIFVISLLGTIFYERSHKNDYKIIDETVEEVAEEEWSELDQIKLGNYKEDLRSYLRKKIDNETYKIR